MLKYKYCVLKKSDIVNYKLSIQSQTNPQGINNFIKIKKMIANICKKLKYYFSFSLKIFPRLCSLDAKNIQAWSVICKKAEILWSD